MKRLATGLLILMAVIFVVSFALQGQFPWLGYVRAAAEGGMVGAIADWFAVTALFRHPLGIPIPHTAIIPSRKDEIGRSLGDFVEENFLQPEIVRGKLASVNIAAKAGSWLAVPANAERLTGEASAAAAGVLELLDDEQVKKLIEQLTRTHLLEPQWAPTIGRLGERLVAEGQHHPAVDALLDTAENWLEAHPQAFGLAVSERLPRWLPGFVDRFVDDRAYREVLAFVRVVRADATHPLRGAVDEYLVRLVGDLQHDPAMIGRVEQLKHELSNSPRLREFAAEAWDAIKETLVRALADPDSPLRHGATQAITELGTRLAADPHLAARLNAWITDAAAGVVETYRHDIAAVITETVERWDPAETSEKLELQVGKDLQFIRINGTVVGALVGLAIYATATFVATLF